MWYIFGRGSPKSWTKGCAYMSHEQLVATWMSFIAPPSGKPAAFQGISLQLWRKNTVCLRFWLIIMNYCIMFIREIEITKS
jgi:hypothetical protein